MRLNIRSLMSMSNLTISPEWRGRDKGISLKDVIIGLTMRRYQHSDAQFLITYTRNDRNTHGLCYRHGGKALYQGQIVNGIPSDVVGFEKESIVVPEVARTPLFVDFFWQGGLIFTEDHWVETVGTINLTEFEFDNSFQQQKWET